MQPIHSAAEVQKLLYVELPATQVGGLEVTGISEGMAEVCVPYHPHMLRPGDSMSGAALMSAADAAMYAVLVAHLGEVDLALTSNFNCNFLARALPGDLIAQARLIKLGRRMAVIEVEVSTTARDDVAAHVVGSYVLPEGRTH